MKFLFTNILGSFVLDEQGKMMDSILFTDLKEFTEKKSEDLLQKKYKQSIPLPQEKYHLFLSLVKEKKYYELFHQRNLRITKKALKASVSDDNLITQAIANMGELDKITNLLSKRFREWYGLYFPEIGEKIASHEKLIEFILKKNKKELMQQFSIKETMGSDLGKEDLEEIKLLAIQLQQLYLLRTRHEEYLTTVMKRYCPNLLELAGVTSGAKLLELGKGLKHLAVLPASTIQLLGAEKALFRHIKTGSRSPKYGILFQHSLVQKAKKQERGKAARSLADKLSLCVRLDYFKGEFKAPNYKKELEERFR